MAENQEKTGLGNYFVANYPPFSFWKPQYLEEAMRVLKQEPDPGTPLGLYLHIPFCRKRCKFCYFRVYTDKNARDVETYINALTKEVELYARQPAVAGRDLQFVYFGGGTPSYLSASQLSSLVERLKAALPWSEAKEVTFECEPGTLQLPKLEVLRTLGVTRLSLGIENFNDKILEENGRAHLSAEIERVRGWIAQLDFPQVNIDLIAGMVGETWENWRDCIQKTMEWNADSVTIYQMELPFNTVYSKEIRGNAEETASFVADWPTKREWVQYAFETLQAAGYSVSSAYTLVKDRSRGEFVYRDSLWHGADMLGTGVASFGHMQGVHMQNVDAWDTYTETLLGQGKLPLHRALPITPKQRLIREMILQLKTGRLDKGYFLRKFEVDITREFESGFQQLESAGILRVEDKGITVTPQGLLQIDRNLPAFFEQEHVSSRYT